MRNAGDPAAVGRCHALQRIVEHIDELIADRPIPPNVAPEDRQYLEAFIATARSIATRIRQSPGYLP